MLKAPIVVFFLFSSLLLKAQSNSSTIFGSLGIINAFFGHKTVSIDFSNWSLGYQKNLRNERFRLVPEISFGNFRSGFLAQDIPDGYFSSTKINLGIDFDALKSFKTSYFIGFGLHLAHSKGYLGLSSTYSYPYYSINGLFSELNGGFQFKIGMRRNLKKAPLGYEFVFLDTHVSLNQTQFSLVRFRLLVNLDKKK